MAPGDALLTPPGKLLTMPGVSLRMRATCGCPWSTKVACDTIATDAGELLKPPRPVFTVTRPTSRSDVRVA